ncbi:unnamed protein product [Ilex paraguariensis]|uniref:Uncharacterized protein n=1 Tax=Ilex paraguariensis TaxID=185542 RepID=A0ABC8QP99_9AQUA
MLTQDILWVTPISSYRTGLSVQVPCPHIFDPAEKYLSLIVPAFNEEHRLPGALDETMK